LGGGRFRFYGSGPDEPNVDGLDDVEVVGEPPHGLTEEPSLSFERDLEEYLVRDLSQIEEGLTLYEGGRQFATDVGRIDILALDGKGSLVVIELKRGTATHAVIGQILSYMGWVRERLANGRKVRGIVVAESFDSKVAYALRGFEDISLKRYRVRLEFEDVGLEVDGFME